jgi:fluoride ion exporter CrcB/FEX
VGTFIINIGGTALLGAFFDLQHAQNIGGSDGSIAACQILQGLIDGFCGALTTVSTWIVELTSLRRRHAYIYGIASIGVSLGLLVIIMGSLCWTVGFQEPACS